MSEPGVFALSLQREGASLVSIVQNRVEAIASEEWVYPLGSEILRSEEMTFMHYVEALEKLGHPAGVRTGKAGVVLGYEMVMIKRTPVALGLDDDLLQGALEWEAQQACISPTEEYTRVATRLPETLPNGNHLYVIVLVRRPLILAIRRLIERVGFQLAEIDVDVFSSIHTVVANYPVADHDTCLIVDLKGESALLTVIKKRDFFLTHRVVFTAPGKGMPSPPEVAGKICKEMKRLAFAHRLGNEATAFSTVFVCGQREVSEMQRSLSSMLSVPVKRVNPFLRARTSERVTGTEEFVQRPERYTASMGWAFKRLPALKTEATMATL